MNKFLTTTAFALIMGTLTISPAFAQTAGGNGSIGTIDENVTQAIPVNPSIKNTQTWNNLLQQGACTAVSAASGGSVTIPTANLLINMGTGAAQQTGDYLYNCTKDAYTQVAGIATSGVNLMLNLVLKYLLWTLAAMVSLGIWILRLAAYIMTLMLGQGSFITNGLVQEAWPFVQGLANLGFIFALLYIAFATTLRLQSVSTSVQRLLPKLLIGALLVNFSLVIGGLLIDTSRLLMAVEFNLIGGGGDSQVTINNIAAKLLQTSNVYGTVFQKNTGLFANSKDSNANPVFVSVAKSDSWSLLIEAIQSLIFVYAVAIGMIVIALGLFWRYIVLLLLLIASPLAYVAVALPQTKHWFDQWWKSFLKWVMYGPIMLFILILIVRVQAIPPIEAVEGDTRTSVYESIIRLIVTVTLMIVAAKISSGSSGVFANSFMGMVGKTGAWAKKNPKMALTLASGGAALPLVGAMAGAQYGANAAKNNVRDFSNAATGNFMKKTRSGSLFGANSGDNPEGLNKLAKFIAGPERDEKGKLKKGEKSYLSPYGEAMFEPEETKAARAAADTVIANAARGNVAINVQNDTNFTLEKLGKKNVATAFSKKQLEKLVPGMSDDQLKLLISRKDVVRKMSDATKTSLLTHNNAEISKAVQSQIRSIENEK